MKKLLSFVMVAIALLTVSFARPAMAGDAAKGAKIFTANCTACHAGGNNVIMRDKSLKKEALEKYNMYSLEAIKTQVTKGKSAMPAFGGRLSSQQIEDVATYVLSKADSGWK
ncbi:cytochrome c6 PetJ [Microseira wollei]|nr:c-type cytochrome [Microseira wollei]